MANEGTQHGITIKNNTIPLGKIIENDILNWWSFIGAWVVRQNVTIDPFTSAQLSTYPDYPTFVLSNKQRFLLIAQNDSNENGLYEYQSATTNLVKILEVADLLGGTAIDITNGIISLRIAPNTGPLTGRYRNLIRTDGSGRIFTKIGTSSDQILQLDANGDLIISTTLLNNKIGGAGGGSGQNLFYMQDVSATGADTSLDNVALTKTFTFTTNENLSHLAVVEIVAYDPPEQPCFEQPSNVVIDRPNNIVTFDLVKILGIPVDTYTTYIILKNPGNAAAYNEIGTPPFSYEQFYPFTHEIQPSLPFVINSVTVNTTDWLQSETRSVSVALYTNIGITELYELLDFGTNFEVVGAIVTNNPAGGSLVFNVRPIGIFLTSNTRTLAFRVRSMPYVTDLHSQNITINPLPFTYGSVTVNTTDWKAGETRTVTITGIYTHPDITEDYTLVDLGSDFIFVSYIDQTPNGIFEFSVQALAGGSNKTLTFKVASGTYETSNTYSNTFYVFADIINKILAQTDGDFTNRSGLGVANSQLQQSTIYQNQASPFVPILAESTRNLINPASATANEMIVNIGNIFNATGSGDRYDWWIGLSTKAKNGGMYAEFNVEPLVPSGEPLHLNYWIRFTNPDPEADASYLTAQFYDTTGAIGATWNAVSSTIKFVITGTQVAITDEAGTTIGGVPRVSSIAPPANLHMAISCRVLNQNPNWNVSLLLINQITLKGEWA